MSVEKTMASDAVRTTSLEGPNRSGCLHHYGSNGATLGSKYGPSPNQLFIGVVVSKYQKPHIVSYHSGSSNFPWIRRPVWERVPRITEVALAHPSSK